MTNTFQLEAANGMDNDTYAEPLQRLADLEWLTYKDSNNSGIDDLFTGQLVEAQHCTSCSRISVSIQTFNILPVPIVEPRTFNGLVYLDDCFTKFGNIEELYGPDGLRCECCNKRQSVATPTMPPMLNSVQGHTRQAVSSPSLGASPILPNGGAGGVASGGVLTPGGGQSGVPRRRIIGSVDSTLGQSLVSPIHASSAQGDIPMLNDSGFQDNAFRTSTPIHGVTSPTAPPPAKLTDGKRRSLLRQLPECLIVQLMRFSYQNGSPHKVQRPVSIPLNQLDLTQLIVDNVMQREDLTALHASYCYDLCGLSLHLGAEFTNQGHYVAYSKAGDGQWYAFDDEKVVAVNMEYELNTRRVRENAYLLFYRKTPV